MLLKNYLRKIKQRLFLVVCLFPSFFSFNGLSSEEEIKSDKRIVLETSSIDSGMFSVFSTILAGLNAYDRGNYPGFHVNFNGGRYHDPKQGPNWWEYYFEPICLGNPKIDTHILTFPEVHKLVATSYVMPRQRAYELIQEYIHVKKPILKKVNKFVKKHFKDAYVIGVHHRGTDKVIEYPLVPYQTTYDAVCKVIEGLPADKKERVKVYVATDDIYFLVFMQVRIPALIFSDFVRSSNHIPLHEFHREGYANNYQKGEEALLDCLLLSKCDALIRPNSNLSIVSGYFNPIMPVITLTANVAQTF